ncbi:hypothetical protein [Rhizobium ruizarguesonis]|uniref:hypothetical protein n=1 Tax=Rhizobium ruizarguesonis TaxID=2081791 RepID=UPI001447A555|nr:hypothetical protein [Rhizobium ruizarguesonis]
MKLIYEATISGEEVHTAGVTAPGEFVKVFVSGWLRAQGKDRVLGFRVNDISSGYRAYALQNGNHAEGRNDETCFVLGRTGWLIDAHIGVEYTFFRTSVSPIITGVGQTTFWHDTGGAGSLFCGDCRGALRIPADLHQISFWGNGGTFDGTMKMYNY